MYRGLVKGWLECGDTSQQVVQTMNTNEAEEGAMLDDYMRMYRRQQNRIK